MPFMPILDGGRISARRLLPALIVLLAVSPCALAASTDESDGSQVRVRTDAGVYVVSAEFEVPQPPAAALAVLTDYERIPHFMPGVTTSTVRERSAERVLIEQEAVARVMMFSRRVYLLLEVREGDDRVCFRDFAHRSFSLYEGAWRLSGRGGRTDIRYELRAKPAFDVPGFLLRRLLGRDARLMIDALREEISARRGASSVVNRRPEQTREVSPKRHGQTDDSRCRR